jgi:hypothetical protein
MTAPASCCTAERENLASTGSSTTSRRSQANPGSKRRSTGKKKDATGALSNATFKTPQADGGF